MIEKKQNIMSQKDRNKLIRLMKELLELDFQSKSISYGEILDPEMKNLVNQLLKKCIGMSL